jgi:hypothetical protein
MVVAAPDFMCQNQSAVLLLNNAGGEPGSGIKYARMKDTTGKTLTLAYRVKWAEGSLVGESEPVLTDKGGRKIPVIEGVVVKGNEKAILGDEDFKAIRDAYHDAFVKMWESPYSTPPIYGIKDPLDVSIDPSSPEDETEQKKNEEEKLDS